MPGGGIFLSISIIQLRCIPSGHAGTHRPAGLRIAQPHALPEAPVFERLRAQRKFPGPGAPACQQDGLSALDQQHRTDGIGRQGFSRAERTSQLDLFERRPFAQQGRRSGAGGDDGALEKGCFEDATCREVLASDQRPLAGRPVVAGEDAARLEVAQEGPPGGWMP